MTDLQAKLAELRVKNDMNERYLKDATASHAHTANGIMAEIDTLEKQIAEAKKPELRHGDYGPGVNCSCEGELRPMIEDYECNLLYCGSASLSDGTNPEASISEVYGNILDDLKALQEDVTEFEVGCRCNSHDKLTVSITCACDDDDMMFQFGNESVHVSSRDLPGFILKLRQMEATIKRK